MATSRIDRRGRPSDTSRPGARDALDEAPPPNFTSAILESLEKSRKVDYDRRLTSVGPHRDEPVLTLDGVDTRTHGSQGEQRTMALAIKLAAHRAVTEMIDEPRSCCSTTSSPSSTHSARPRQDAAGRHADPDQLGPPRGRAGRGRGVAGR